ncbi:MAG: DNA repair protein RecO [Sedimentitalea sp.]
MEWRDQGILLRSRKHGESAAIIDVFTPEHGVHAGVVRGGAGRKIAPVLQPGAQLDLGWRARLEDHIGSFQVEPVRSRAAAAMSGRMTLAGLNAVTSMLLFSLPEREPHPQFYARTEQLLDLLGQDEIWPLAYLGWEIALLDATGFGLDLGKCAVTGSVDDLIYVSPRSGRAVSRKGAGEWADRLLPLPPCLLGEGPAPDRDIATALRTTAHFLTYKLAKTLGNKPLPDARARFVEAFNRRL